MSLFLCSAGLHRRRRDITTILDAAILPWGVPARFASGFVGWGLKPSGSRAAVLANRHGRTLHLFEDGFLSGHFAGRATASVSYTLDSRAPHYDGARASDLEDAIRDATLDGAARQRAVAAALALRTARLTKYNDAPIASPEALGLPDRPFALLVEQVEGDLSLGGDGAEVFERMIDRARDEAPDHLLVVRPHPAAKGHGPLEAAAKRHGANALVLRERCNPWPLLERAARVHTHSSHLGFEALMAERPVTVWGRPFYAGWGLTTDVTADRAADRVDLSRRGVERDLASVFHAAYIRTSRYLDLHDRQPTTLERTIEALTALRDTQLRNTRPLVTAGFSPNKRRTTAPFLSRLDAAPRHARSFRRAAGKAGAGGAVAVWGAAAVPDKTVPLVRLEDGFVRSVGLGAALNRPFSLIVEARDHLPFDARGTNGIERALLEAPPDAAEKRRARALVERIVALGITKYMLTGAATALPEDGRFKVLVVGQVETDASIRFGSPRVKTNTALLEAVRALFPEALIAYRDHPDVAAGLRPGRAERTHVDLEVGEQAIADLLAWCDRVETITSLTGFEALLRGKPVGTHGRPFYAGWGLTDDRLDLPPRGQADLDALTAAALLRAPSYIHPRSRLPCSPERVVEAFADPPPLPVHERLLQPAGLALGRIRRRLGAA